jgi:hypothetical protein
METVLKDRDALVALYAPYCEGDAQPQLLERALDKLLTRRINGSRRLKPDGSHPFELTWQPGESPQELSQCLLSFPQIQAVTYNFSVPTAELVLWLMQILDYGPATPPPGLPPLQLPAQPLPVPRLGLPRPPLPLPPLPLAGPLLQAPPPAKGTEEAGGPPDLPDSFWCWLLVGFVPPERSA